LDPTLLTESGMKWVLLVVVETKTLELCNNICEVKHNFVIVDTVFSVK
jgi:hypothetical protein